MKKRLAIVLSALAATAFGSSAPAAGAATEPFVPFVTDFPRPAAAPAPDRSASGIDWADAGIGGGVGAAVAALLAAAALALVHRGRPARS